MTIPIFPVDAQFHAPLERLGNESGPKNRPLMALEAGQSTLLKWDTRPQGKRVDLVLTIALDIHAQAPLEIRIYTGENGPQIASTPVICADPYQVLTIPLPPDAIPASGPLTLRIELQGDERLWFFAPDATVSDGLEYHTPHLVEPKARPAQFLERLCSLASLQTFSWKEGCVLDGLTAVAQSGLHSKAATTLRQHLDYFGFSSGDLVYESPRNVRLVNEITTIETTLPFAHVAALNIHHPWISLALDYWQKQLDTRGQVYEDTLISSEGAYTVAYPMTTIGVLLNEPRWIAIAEDLLIQTYEHLVQPEGIYLRHYMDGRRTHRNWARGLAWLLMGHVQTLRQQPKPSERLHDQLNRIAAFAANHQLKNGLWACFVDEPGIAADCAGSAGIAAAFAISAASNLLPSSFRARALQAREALHARISAEGWPEGCSQSNKAGEELQRSDYRVCTTYVLGLLGNLEAYTR